MNNDIEKNLGKQPIAKIIAEHGLSPHDIVQVSTEQITHKMIGRAVNGRRLALKVQCKICNALNKAAKKNYSLKDLFNY